MGRREIGIVIAWFCVLLFIVLIVSVVQHRNLHKFQNVPSVPVTQVFQGTKVSSHGEMTQVVILLRAQVVPYDPKIHGTRLYEATTSAVKELERQGYKVVEKTPLWVNEEYYPLGVVIRYKDQ